MKLRNIRKRFSKNEVLHNVNLSIEKGKIIGIVGENGSGKSTLLKIILSLIKRYSGEIENEYELKATGIIEEPKFILSMTGRENLYYLLNETEFNKIDHFVRYFHMESYIDEKVHKYSLGMKQRLALVYVFSSNAEIYVLDEPTNFLDIQGVNLFINQINIEKQNGKTILIVSHEIDKLANYCDHVYLLKNGNLDMDILKKNNGNFLIYIFEFMSHEQALLASHMIENNFIIKDDTKIYIQINRNEVPEMVRRLVKFDIVSIIEKRQNLIDIYLEMLKVK